MKNSYYQKHENLEEAWLARFQADAPPRSATDIHHSGKNFFFPIRLRCRGKNGVNKFFSMDREVVLSLLSQDIWYTKIMWKCPCGHSQYVLLDPFCKWTPTLFACVMRAQSFHKRQSKTGSCASSFSHWLPGNGTWNLTAKHPTKLLLYHLSLEW